MNADILNGLWGTSEHHLTMLQMGVRAFIAFILALALVRIAGRRSFGMKSPFDNTFAILIGAIMAKGIIGEISFSGGMVACLVLAVTHRAFAFISIKSGKFGTLIKGDKILLFKNGKIDEGNMIRSLISERDLMEKLRMSGYESLDQIKFAYMERNGEISFIGKD